MLNEYSLNKFVSSVRRQCAPHGKDGGKHWLHRRGPRFSALHSCVHRAGSCTVMQPTHFSHSPATRQTEGLFSLRCSLFDNTQAPSGVASAALLLLEFIQLYKRCLMSRAKKFLLKVCLEKIC